MVLSMPTLRRIRSFSLAAVFMGCWTLPAVIASELNNDFRESRFDNNSLSLFGKQASQMVKPTAAGLLVRIPPKMGNLGPVGIALRSQVCGDFSIKTTYKLLEFASPPTVAGLRVKLVIELSSPTKDTMSIERAAIPKEGNVCTSTVTKVPAGSSRRSSFRRQPVEARSGSLRVSRKGDLVRVEYTDDSGQFRTLREVVLGPDKLSRVSLVLDTGRSNQGAAILLEDLRISADEFGMPLTARTDSVPRGIKVVVATMTVLLFIVIGFMLLQRSRRSNSREGARDRAHPSKSPNTTSKPS